MNGKKIKSTLLIAVFILSTIAIAIPLVSAAEHDEAVDRYSSTMVWEATYTTIQAAIDGATTGDIIEVDAGTYTENVDVHVANIALVGAGSGLVTVTALVNTTSVFTVSANDVNITGFTATGTEFNTVPPYTTAAGIHIEDAVSGCFISDNILVDNYDGIYLGVGTGPNTLTGNDVSGNYQGVEMIRSDGNTFTDNIVSSNYGKYGFYIESGDSNIFIDNEVCMNERDGFYLVVGGGSGNNYNIFANNTIDGNLRYGLRLHGGEDNEITGNTFDDNGLIGILLYDELFWSSPINYLDLIGNTITNNPIGIKYAAYNDGTVTDDLQYPWRVEIHNNEIAGNTIGIEYGDTSGLDARWNWWGHDTGPSGFGSGDGDTIPDNVEADPWIGMAELEVTPESVQGEYEGWFDFTLENTGSNPSFYYVELYWDDFVLLDVSSPPGWFIWYTSYDYVEFGVMGGYELELGEEVTFRLKLRAPAVTDLYTMYYYGYNTMDEYFEVYSPYEELLPTIAVDADDPVVTVDHPIAGELTDGYSAGSGDKVWINATIFDEFDVTPTLYINATFDYSLSSPTAVTGGYEWTASFYNTAPIPDGPLVFYVNATDGAGNEGTSGTVEVEIDNTAPIVTMKIFDDDTGLELPKVEGMYYMGNDVETIRVNYTATDIDFDTGYSSVYINDTVKFSGATAISNNKLNWTQSVTGIDYLVINVTMTDTALPNNHTTVLKHEVSRDLIPPYELGFDEVEAISGGLIIRGLYAEDIVGVLDYVIYLNETYIKTITDEALLPVEVLDLSSYAGEPVNITVFANDYGLNPTDKIILYEGLLPEGLSYPIGLDVGWNLISLPMLPDDSSVLVVLADILGDLESVWSYNEVTGGWLSFAPGVPSDLTEMNAGDGYWLKMATATTLTVHGLEMPEPPATPPTYEVYEGWNLIGFKSLVNKNCTDYLAGVAGDYVRIYDFYDGAYHSVDFLAADPGDFVPGRGYWIAMSEGGIIYP